MLQLADGFDLDLETGNRAVIAAAVAFEQLDGHCLLESQVPGQIDGAHASFAELLLQLVVADQPTGVGSGVLGSARLGRRRVQRADHLQGDGQLGIALAGFAAWRRPHRLQQRIRARRRLHQGLLARAAAAEMAFHLAGQRIGHATGQIVGEHGSVGARFVHGRHLSSAIGGILFAFHDAQPDQAFPAGGGGLAPGTCRRLPASAPVRVPHPRSRTHRPWTARRLARSFP